jgi:hypothetical protein
MLRRLQNFSFSSYDGNTQRLTGRNDVMAEGSQNVLITGTGTNQIFKGITVKGAVQGSKVMMNAGDGYGGLGDYNETGIGSVFKVLGALFYIGAGKLYWNGTYQSSSASTTLSLKKFTSGSLGTAYQAGLAQPSAPTISAVTAPAGYTGKNNGNVTVKIARVRSQTGARSIASLSSNIVSATAQSIAVTFPSADSNGQDYWEIDVTQNGYGGEGPHYFLSTSKFTGTNADELAESVLTATVVASRVATNAITIGVANGTLTSANIGWQYTSSGDTTTYVTAVGASDSYSAGNQAITLNVANGSTNTQSATFTRAVAGVTRTYVIEWVNADVIGADLAPTRDYPPPAAIFGGVSGDVTFVDGAYGDTVDLIAGTANTSTSSVGNVIAVSDPAKPESYPPDNFIFTNDSPTCLIDGGHGIYWRFGANSMGVIKYIGGSPALSYERVWTGIGVQKQHNACLGSGGRLYAYTGARGLVRLGVNGEPDTLFAAPVHADMAGFTAANVVLTYDTNNGYLLVMHGSTILCYYEALDVWCAPLSVSSTVGSRTAKSAVTINGGAYLCFGGASDINLYDFNVGAGTQGIVTTPWQVSQGVTDNLSRIYLLVRNDDSDDATVETYVNGSTSARTSQTVAFNGAVPSAVLKPNVRQARTWRVKVTMNASSTGTSNGFDLIQVDGSSQEIPR